MPSGLSPSSLAAWGQCPTRWAYEKVVRIPTWTGVPAMAGTQVHRALELVIPDNPARRTLERALYVSDDILARCFDHARACNPDWTPTPPDHVDDTLVAEVCGPDDGHTHRFVADLCSIVPDHDDLRDRAHRGLRSYFAMSRDPASIDVVAVELAVDGVWRTTSGPVPVRGVIDRVDRLPSGGLSALDYKTGRAPNPRFDDGSYARQLAFYAAMLRMRTGRLPDAGVIAYLGHGDDEPHGTAKVLQFDDDQVDEFMEDVGATWREMHARFDDGLDYPTEVGPLCGWCPFVAMCPDGEAEVRRRDAAKSTGKGGVRADAPAREALNLPAAEPAAA